MMDYVVVANFTEQGIHAIKETSRRAKLLRDSATKSGIKIKDIFWTLGQYDVVFTLSAPSDEVMASFMMRVGSLGNMKCQSLRAFGEDQIDSILSKV